MNKIIQSIESDPKPPEETELTKEQVKKFLEELTELTRKHGIKVCGCGCCGSPWLDVISIDELGYEYEVSSDWSSSFDSLIFTGRKP